MEAVKRMTDEFDDKIEAFEVPAKKIGAIDLNLREETLKIGFKEPERMGLFRKNESDLVIVGARPGNGKTAFLVQALINAARTEGATMLFSLEMSASSLTKRIYSLESETAVNKLWSLPDSKKLAVKQKLATTDFFIDDTKGIDINTLRARVLDFRRRQPLVAVGVDYAQLVRSTSRGRSRNEEVLEVIEGLKTLACDIEAPVIALAQMSREIEKRQQFSQSARPVMSDLADCGGIERWADQILFMDRPDRRDPSRVGQIDFYVAKNRHGETRDFTLAVRWECTKFYNHEETSL